MTRRDVVSRVPAMLLERGQDPKVGLVALRDDRLDRRLGALDRDGGDFARREVGEVARAVTVIRKAERRRADFPAAGQVAQHPHVAFRAVGKHRFADHDDGLALLRLQRVQDGGDLLDDGERARSGRNTSAGLAARKLLRSGAGSVRCFIEPSLVRLYALRYAASRLLRVRGSSLSLIPSRRASAVSRDAR